MTSERRIVVSLSDIKLVSYECKTCGAKISFAPDSKFDASNRCFQCKTEWRKDAPLAADFQPITPAEMNASREAPSLRLMRAIADMRNPDIAGGYGFRVLMEFDEPTTLSSVRT
jgi:hypothetical protein